MGPNAAAKEFIDPAILTTRREPGPGDRRQAPGAARPRAGAARRIPQAVADPSWRLSRRRSRRPRPSRRQPSRIGGCLASRLPGIAWLIALFVVPLVDDVRGQPGQPRRARPDRARPSVARQLPARPRPGVPADVPQLAPVRGGNDDPVARHRLPDRLLDQPLRRSPQGAAAGHRDAAVLDELPHPDLRLDDRPARQRRRSTRSSRRWA